MVLCLEFSYLYCSFSGGEDFKEVFKFKMMVEEFVQCNSGSQENVGERWIKPYCGRVVNTDAAFRGGKASIAFVVRNEEGGTVLLAAKPIEFDSVYGAEIAAILWASEVASQKNWRMLCCAERYGV